jgi:hypothetical protein
MHLAQQNRDGTTKPLVLPICFWGDRQRCVTPPEMAGSGDLLRADVRETIALAFLQDANS